ncbi:MAG: DegQ family serine endoprotease [Labrys sp. (in: a-proteobacteria)]
MTDTQSNTASFTGVLRRHRRGLMASVFGLAALGLVAGGMVDVRTTTPALAGTTASMMQQPGFADVVDKVSPAVVSVKVKSAAPRLMSDRDGREQFGAPDLPPDHPMQRWFREFGFGAPEGREQQRARPAVSQGSGFFITKDGYVVTNNHVVDDATDVEVVTNDGKTYAAKVIGTDPKTDLALLKVEEGGSFPTVALAPKSPRVGDWVLAVGNPFGLGGTVTAGIVSARGRDIGAGPYDDFLQIDAAVNRGNSGGPTFDLNGNVIGVNTAIFSPSGGNVGIAFAIPAETVEKVVAALKEDGQVTRGWIGVQIQPVTQDIADSVGLTKPQGAIVAALSKGGPADEAGLKSGDAILSVDGKTVEGPKDLARLIASMEPGAKAEVTVWRDGAEKTITVELGKLPKEQRRADASPATDEKASTSLAALGLELAPAEKVIGDGTKGVAVVDVDPASAAAEQLRRGDIIVDVAGQPVNSVADVRDAVSEVRKEGRRSVLMRVVNGEDTRFVALPLKRA